MIHSEFMGVFRNGERIVSYYDRKYDFKSERKSDKSEIDFSVRGRLFQFEIIFGTG